MSPARLGRGLESRQSGADAEPRLGVVAVLVSGAGFVVGALSWIPVGGQALADHLIVVVVQAVVGCGAMAWAFRAAYPAVRLWWIGVLAVIVGTAPAWVWGRYFFVLALLGGLVLGWAFGLLLRRDDAVKRMVIAGLGSQALFVASVYPWAGVLDSLGCAFGLEVRSSFFALYSLPSLLFGVTLALGVRGVLASPGVAVNEGRRWPVGVVAYVLVLVVVAGVGGLARFQVAAREAAASNVPEGLTDVIAIAAGETRTAWR